MGSPAPTETSLSLLKKLKLEPANQGAWRDFVERYGGKILGWCRYWRLQDADASDVTQVVLLKVANNIRKFDRKIAPFRAWLKTIAHHAWYDLVNSRQHRVVRGGEALERSLEAEEARDDLARHLEAAWDQELLELASDRVRLRVHPNTWAAFERTAIDGAAGQQVAEELDLSITSVYKARSNVKKMLQEEVASIEGTEFG